MSDLRDKISLAASLLRDGKLVAFPTETVYGLGADALNEFAVARIFEVKQRPKFDPLIVHIANRKWLSDLVQPLHALEQQLIDAFWPGPLSIVLRKTDVVPDLVTAGLSTVAIRIPAHPLTQQLLELVDLPIAAPSANPFGMVSPTTAAHVDEQLGTEVDYILDGGATTIGLESTVVRVENHQVQLLRPGGLPQEEIEDVVGKIERIVSKHDSNDTSQNDDLHSNDSTNSPLSPGMLSRHYAPRTPLLISGVPTGSRSQRIGLLTWKRVETCDQFAQMEVLSETGDLTVAATQFFAALRRLDAAGLDLIVALPFPEEGLGRAMNDRLRRAAAQ